MVKESFAEGKENLLERDKLGNSLLDIDPEKALQQAEKVKGIFGEVMNQTDAFKEQFEKLKAEGLEKAKQ